MLEFTPISAPRRRHRRPHAHRGVSSTTSTRRSDASVPALHPPDSVSTAHQLVEVTYTAPASTAAASPSGRATAPRRRDRDGEWVAQLYADGAPKYTLGNEARRYFGGEDAYYLATDPVQASTQQLPAARRVGRSPARRHARRDPLVRSRRGEPDVGDGDDSITVVTTHSGSTRITTGAGTDRVAVREINGPTTIHTGNGDRHGLRRHRRRPLERRHGFTTMHGHANRSLRSSRSTHGDGNLGPTRHRSARIRTRPSATSSTSTTRPTRRTTVGSLTAARCCAASSARGGLDGVLEPRASRHPSRRRGRRQHLHGRSARTAGSWPAGERRRQPPECTTAATPAASPRRTSTPAAAQTRSTSSDRRPDDDPTGAGIDRISSASAAAASRPTRCRRASSTASSTAWLCVYGEGGDDTLRAYDSATSEHRQAARLRSRPI